MTAAAVPSQDLEADRLPRLDEGLGGRLTAGTAPETPFERRQWAAMSIAADLLSVEALAFGEPVPASAVRGDWREWLGLQDGADVVLDDALARRIELVRRARLVGSSEEAPAAQPFSALDLAAFLAKPPEPPDWDLEGWFARGDLVLAFGDPGVGKSIWALALAIKALPT